MRWLMALLVATLLAVGAVPARAAASRVALVRPGAPPPKIAEASTRVRAELEAAGFEVVSFEARGTDPPAQVAGAQLAPPPFAIVALVATDGGAAADVWIDRSLAGDGSKRRVEVEDTSAGTASALAVRSMELLRAALLEETGKPRPQPAALPDDVARWLAAGKPPPPVLPSKPSPPPTAPGAAREPPPGSAAARTTTIDAAPLPPLLSSTSLEGGLAWLHGFRGFGAAFGPTLRLTVPLAPSTALRASLLAAAITATEVEGAAGSAALRQELLLVEATRALGDGTVVPLLSAGVGGYHLLAEGFLEEGRVEAGYTSDIVHCWAFAVGAGAGAAVRLGPRVALALDARGVLVLPEPLVQIAGDEARRDGDPTARAGLPMLLMSLGVVAAL